MVRWCYINAVTLFERPHILVGLITFRMLFVVCGVSEGRFWRPKENYFSDLNFLLKKGGVGEGKRREKSNELSRSAAYFGDVEDDVMDLHVLESFWKSDDDAGACNSKVIWWYWDYISYLILIRWFDLKTQDLKMFIE